MPGKISTDDVRKIARLSRLELTDDEVSTYTEQLEAVLEYMDELSTVNTDEVPEKVHAIELTDVLREDEPTGSMEHKLALRESPQHDDTFFIVPRVFDQ